MYRKRQLPSGNAGIPGSSSRRPNTSSVRSTLSSLGSKLSFYDVALAVLPVPLVVGFLAEELLSLTPGAGVAVGAAASALAVGYLLFGNPPMRSGSSENREEKRHGRRDGAGGPAA